MLIRPSRFLPRRMSVQQYARFLNQSIRKGLALLKRVMFEVVMRVEKAHFASACTCTHLRLTLPLAGPWWKAELLMGTQVQIWMHFTPGVLGRCNFFIGAWWASCSRTDMESCSSHVYMSKRIARMLLQIWWRMAEWARLFRNMTWWLTSHPQSLLLKKGCGEIEGFQWSDRAQLKSVRFRLFL